MTASIQITATTCTLLLLLLQPAGAFLTPQSPGNRSDGLLGSRLRLGHQRHSSRWHASVRIPGSSSIDHRTRRSLFYLTNNDNDEKKEDDNDFHKNIAAAVIMHPGYIIKKHDNLKEVLNFPVIMCWAKDDPHVNYDFFAHRYIDAGANIVGPETGGHGSFPSFDQDASKFIHGISIIK